MSERILTVRGVCLSFGGVAALDDVDLHVDDGELVALIGPNGAGKTSLFNVISGVYLPSAGQITVAGDDLTAAGPTARAGRGVARTFQNLELFPLLSVVENIMVGRHRHLRSGLFSGGVWWGRSRREEAEHRLRAEEIIDFLEIEDFRDEPIPSLPYGVRKRVELGRALAMEPRLLLLDEPVAGMNQEETEDIGRLILDIKEELKIAQLLVEHDIGVVMDLADRVVVLDQGAVVAQGTPDEVSRDPHVIEAYLGTGAPGGAE